MPQSQCTELTRIVCNDLWKYDERLCLIRFRTRHSMHARVENSTSAETWFGRRRQNASAKQNFIRFLHLVLSCGVPFQVSPKILKHYDKSYGMYQRERSSAGNVVRSRITLLCLKFDVLSVQYCCFLEALKHQRAHCTIFVRLTETITSVSLESYENQHVNVRNLGLHSILFFV